MRLPPGVRVTVLSDGPMQHPLACYASWQCPHATAATHLVAFPQFSARHVRPSLHMLQVAGVHHGPHLHMRHAAHAPLRVRAPCARFGMVHLLAPSNGSNVLAMHPEAVLIPTSLNRAPSTSSLLPDLHPWCIVFPDLRVVIAAACYEGMAPALPMPQLPSRSNTPQVNAPEDSIVLRLALLNLHRQILKL